MKISFDMDGTVWSHMAYFRTMMIAFKAQGHEIGILTGHRHTMKDDDIALLVARGFPKPDFWFGREEPDMPFNGAIMKSRRILSEKIDYHYDDLDFNNPDTLRLFKEGLKEQFYRLIIVTHREPVNTHFE